MQQPEIALEILSGWKQIANHLGIGVRTAQRYEREMELPVRRPAGKFQGEVIATKAELDAWVIASPLRKAFRLPRTPVDNATPLSEFRLQVKEMHRLRVQAAELRAALAASLELLQKNLCLALPQESRESSSGPRLLAEALAFSPKRTDRTLNAYERSKSEHKVS